LSRKARTDYICSQAYELAASGLHLEPITIVSTLINQGYPEAAKVLPNLRSFEMTCGRSARAIGRETFL
jgi:hypothetical protein